MKTSHIVIIVVAIIVIIIALMFILGSTKEKDDATSESDLKVSISQDDWQRGDDDAPIEIVVYSDYFCPGCRTFHKISKTLLDKYAGKIKFVHRHYPIASLHPTAFDVASAAEAAGLQGKFWEMHDALMEANSLEDADVLAIANSLGLNMDQFKSDRTNNAVKERVKNDMKSGNDSSVNYTPYIFINNEEFDISTVGFSLETVSAKIDQILQSDK